MGSSGDRVEEMEIVGQYAAVEEFLTERSERFSIVVDSAQQHRLVQQLRPGGFQFVQSGPHGCVDLIGVVAMHDQHDI